jgi:hypothetical protein
MINERWLNSRNRGDCSRKGWTLLTDWVNEKKMDEKIDEKINKLLLTEK